MKPITEIMTMSDPGDCFWTDEGLIGLGELGLGDLSGLASEFTEPTKDKEVCGCMRSGLNTYGGGKDARVAEYIRFARKVVAGARGVNRELEECFDRVASNNPIEIHI